jgi:CRISPR-associated protein (TIGR02584 family)
MQKRILLAVSGMSPQIVTETLFSLATRAKNQFIPTDIFLITTADGKKQAEQQLLHPESGKFHQFCKDYQMPVIAFPAENILVIEDADGLPLNDIKTPENNEAAADFITRTVRNLTLDEDSALHVSIAGGRKTMGYYLGYALSLYGRKQDSLSHVLVTDHYEGLPDFFYPTPYSKIIYDKRNERSLDTKDAEVMLAEIPFVRLIDGNVPLFLQQAKVGFSDSVRMAQALEEAPLLEITRQADKNHRLLASALHLPIPLTDVNFAFYVWMLGCSFEGKTIQRRLAIKLNADYAKSFLAVYEAIFPEMHGNDRVINGLKENNMKKSFLSDRMNDINTAFVTTLGQRAAQSYLIQSLEIEDSGICYFVKLSESEVVFL